MRCSEAKVLDLNLLEDSWLVKVGLAASFHRFTHFLRCGVVESGRNDWGIRVELRTRFHVAPQQLNQRILQKVNLFLFLD